MIHGLNSLLLQSRSVQLCGRPRSSTGFAPHAALLAPSLSSASCLLLVSAPHYAPAGSFGDSERTHTTATARAFEPQRECEHASRGGGGVHIGAGESDTVRHSGGSSRTTDDDASAPAHSAARGL